MNRRHIATMVSCTSMDKIEDFLVGQELSAMRFIVQWFVDEQKKESVIPVAFWYFSIIGGITLLIYAIHLGDPVIITGQASGIFIYLRNLFFIYKKSRATAVVSSS